MAQRTTDNRSGKSFFHAVECRTETGKRRWSLFGGVARLGLLFALGCISGGVGLATGGYLFFSNSLPSMEKLKDYRPPIVSHVYGSKGELLADYADERRHVMPVEQIPKMVQDAFIAAEDKHFWSHEGIDKMAIARAIVQNITRRGKPGASTITQQVAKTFLLTPEKTFSRKITEAILSTRMERNFDKPHILFLYLNQIYLGSGAYGVEAAAQTYFGKTVKDLTVAECAMLGGLAQRPGRHSPKTNLEKSLQRRSYVLRRMLEDGYITQAQYEGASEEEPKIVQATNPHETVAPDFVSHIQKYIAQKYGTNALQKEGLKIYTTVDLALTKAARAAVETGLRELDKRQGYRGPVKTLNAKGVVDFLEEKSRAMDAPLRFGQIVEGVITQIDNENVYARMGSCLKGEEPREYAGQIKIDPGPKWWVRTPYIRPELRKRNFSDGDLPFHVGDVIQVRLVDPNVKRRELYLKKFGKTDPEMTNYKHYTEEMMTYFLLEPEQEPVAQAALMLRDNRTGHVKVMLGGRSAAASEFNRATQAKRQLGSSFKPMIYAAALHWGYTAADIIVDEPFQWPIPQTGEIYRPKNYTGGYAGRLTLRNCLVHSRNIPTAKILQRIGIDYARSYAGRLGYTLKDLSPVPSLALGSSNVSLEDQITAYAVFPNRGYAVPNAYITRIIDRNGKVLEEHSPPVLLDDPVPKDVPVVRPAFHQTSRRSSEASGRLGTPLSRRTIDEGTAYIITTMLQGVVQEGTATVLKKIVGRPDIAGKTGTTNECVDAWFMGFTPDYTCGVWVGFDEEISLGRDATGGKAAAPIWGYFMKEVLKDKPVKDFPTPASVEFRKVDPRTGLASASANAFQEVFKLGSGPSEADTKILKGSRWDYSGSDLDQF